MTPACDIVVPVHGALSLTLDLLESLERFTDTPHRVLLQDDGSDAHVAEALRAAAARNPAIDLERSEENRGFVRTANAGLARSTAPYACVLNSDTVVTRGWLERLIRCAESDAAILVVNPLSNAAVNLSVVIPPGHSIHMMADRLAGEGAPRALDVVTAVGFCLLLKRAALERYGVFDEAYGAGYCEESDYCMRVLADGGRVVAASDAFVYHKGSGSFTDRDLRYAANRALFDRRWAPLYRRLYAEFAARDPLAGIRERLFAGTVVAGHLWQSQPQRSLSHRAWRALGHLRRGNVRLIAERGRETLARVAARAAARTRAATDPGGPAASRAAPLSPEDQPLAFPSAGYVRALPRAPHRLRIVFLVLDAPLSGGVLEIRQIANRLVLEGHDALIATVSREEMFRRLGLLTQPLVFRDEAQLVELLPEADVVVATHWRTAWAWMPALAAQRRFLPVYYVQDLEADFYPPTLPEHARALESYGRVAHLVTTSRWLVERLGALGRPATRIPCGIDLGVFYPRGGREPGAPFTLTAITRPDPEEARRGFAELIAACAAVHREDPSIRFEFFGCPESAMPRRLSFPYVHHGRVGTPEAVARHLSRCDLLVDPSRVQAFGRPGLEAMACGTPTVLPRGGGIDDYAQDGVSTLSFAGGDAAALARAILAVRRDAELRGRLARAGLEAAQGFDHRAEGRRHLEFYRAALAARVAS